MLIKQHGFKILLPPTLPRIWILNGEDPYLGLLFRYKLKQIFIKILQESAIHKRLYIYHEDDWDIILSELNNYSLFIEPCILEIYYNKKKITTAEQHIIINNLLINDPMYFILLYMPNINAKALQLLSNNDCIGLLSMKIPNAVMIEHWIISRLNKNKLVYNPQIPKLIYQYTQSNLLACSQLIEKISLTKNNNLELTEKEIRIHLIDQSIYQLYELSDHCLNGKPDQALLILRSLLSANYEPILILWAIAQSIRNLIQFNQFQPDQSKILPNKIKIYRHAQQRCSEMQLNTLLNWCNKLDTQIKTHTHAQALSMRLLELLILDFCTGSDTLCYMQL